MAIVAGWVIGRLKMEAPPGRLGARHAARSQPRPAKTALTLAERIDAGFASVREIVGKVWPYILAGIAIGAGIHG